ncbi:MAG TPA: Rid family hydrolase [Thermomicrobiales bacterium]|nr:Rid family hydrolase [Thermomicrobiales bacterium]
MKEHIRANAGAAPSGSYSPAIRAGDFVFVSGQGPTDPATGEVVGDTIDAQTERRLLNVRAIVEAAGGLMADVVNVAAHLADIAHFDAYDRVDRTHFAEPRPARTTVGSALAGILVELDAIADLPRHGER